MITGDTKVYAIIADPISQVRTPEVLNEIFVQSGTDALLVPIQVAPDGLEIVVTAFRSMKNLGGFVVSHPHKSAINALCDEVSTAGHAIGSVNAVRREVDGRLLGDMFDGKGFVAGLRSQGREPAGCRTLLAGAGGAATAIAFALAEVGVAALTVTNPVSAKAEEIVTRVARHFPMVAIQAGGPDPTGYELVINATSLSVWTERPLPVDTTRLMPGMIVAETIMKPENTPLLTAASARGCTIHHGRHMLDQQICLISKFIGAMAS